MSADNSGSLPRINEAAPDFETKSTHGVIRLSDYKGKWVMLFSHPADFTPVCSTEFMAFARRYAEFQALNVQPIGISIDSVFSHIAWVRSMEETGGVKIPFPVVADLDMKVAQSFGMIHPATSDTAPIRAVFFIDPKQVIRAILYYPQSTGRSVDELLRVFSALQTTDAHGVSTPADWKTGGTVVLPPPQTQADAEKRVADTGLKVKQWYLVEKQL
ncbi:MAG TPA: peroxiredoxin [Terriglobales bacterium]|jgi:peroxiredoxin (alkyl hydroperoxide reductase subunit C)